MNAGTAVVWMRNDLRLADNPALAAAAASYETVAPVFIWSSADEGVWTPGTASRSWRALSLQSLATDISSRGGVLTVLAGPTAETLARFSADVGARTVLWNRRYEPTHVALDAAVERELIERGFSVRTFPGSMLHEPGTIMSGQGTPLTVFTPFYHAALRAPDPDPPLPAPDRLPAPPSLPGVGALDVMAPPADAAPDLARYWTPGETGAAACANRFFADLVFDYAENRDRPDLDGTSRLSPHLAFGEVSPRALVARASEIVRYNGHCVVTEGAVAFMRQLYWREFAYHLLHHFPLTPAQPLKRRFDVFPWSRDPVRLEAWQHGMTGFPIVDAGMREMLATGWMHNRVRMSAASFLTKDLLLPWSDGAHWFWERLADADLANNTFGWQWVAGTGADAAPYFRIFNPVRQGERFDPDGVYVKRWVPELAQLPANWVHRPWSAPPAVLASAGITLGSTYPEPVVDHAAARLRALAVYGSIRDVAE